MIYEINQMTYIYSTLENLIINYKNIIYICPCEDIIINLFIDRRKLSVSYLGMSISRYEITSTQNARDITCLLTKQWSQSRCIVRCISVV